MAKLKIETVHDFSSRDEWEEWLAQHHASEREAWLRFAKKGTEAVRVSRADALEAALCYGWIDGQAASQDDEYWLQRFTPRTRRSKWSRINRDAAEELIAAGMMKPAGHTVGRPSAPGGRQLTRAAPRLRGSG